MKIRTQLITLLLAATVIVPATVGSIYMSAAHGKNQRRQIEIAETLVGEATQLRQIAIEAILLQKTDAAAQWQDKIISIKRVIAQMPAGSPEELAGIEHIHKNIGLTELLFDNVRQVGSGDSVAETAAAVQPQAGAIDSLLSLNQEIIDTGATLIRAKRDDHAATLNLLNSLTIAGLTTLAVLIILMLRLISRDVLRPMARIELGTKRIASGDYAYRLNLQSDNEIGELAVDFDAMTAKVEKTQNALMRSMRDNDALLRALNAHAIISITDPTGKIIQVNDAFCQISGYSHDELLGQNHRIINSTVHAPEFWMEMWSVISSGAPWHSQICNRGKEDYIYWVDSFISPFIGDDGKIDRYISICIDISDSKMNEAQLQVTTELAQESSKAKSQFLANMSHEIRTPMNAILGMLALLRRTELNTRQADYAAKTEGAARSLLNLLNDILDISKVEAGKLVLEPQPFNFDVMLRDLSVIFSTNMGNKPIEVLFDIDEALPVNLVGDGLRLQQVLINLGGNAIKFTEVGEVLLSIKVMQRNDESVTLQMSVRDTGIGIAPENHARIFTGFTQAEASTTRRFGGTGLGVAISYSLVVLMGGELELESALGEGSRFFFTITLPLAPDNAFIASDAPPLPPKADIAWRTLIVDDNPTARDVLRRTGLALGWQVNLADSGEQALAMLQQTPAPSNYQAILVDWQMPDLDGWQTCQRIRTLGLANGTPLIAMVTAHTRELLLGRSKAEQELLDGFLVKPVTASMLLSAVTEARNKHSLPHSARPSSSLNKMAKQRLAGMRLLLTEDNLNNQQVACELLEDEGASIQVANNGQEAVDALTANPQAFDLVLMDLQMPVMDGLTAARHIRQELGLLTLPIVAMTANAMSTDREACLAVGMNDHVGKPFDLNHLVRVLLHQTGRSAIDSSDGGNGSGFGLSADISASAASANIDINAALRRLGGKKDIYERMLRTFALDVAQMPAQLHIHLASDEMDTARRLLHTLKGLAATLGITQLSAQAADGEKLIATRPAINVAITMADQLGESIATTMDGLQKLLNALGIATAAAKADNADAADEIDVPVLLNSLDVLKKQLANSDMAATTTMSALIDLYADALGQQIAPLDNAINALDFDSALHQCQLLEEYYSAARQK